jgi:hypothetical protein
MWVPLDTNKLLQSEGQPHSSSVDSARGKMASPRYGKPIVSAASNPPLHKTQGQGTHSFGTGGENWKSKAWATRHLGFPAAR